MASRARSRSTRARGRGKDTVVDLSKVEGRRPTPKEGDYILAVAETTMEKGDAGPYVSWKFEIADGPFEGSQVYHNTSLATQALFNLRGVLEALGVEIPEEAFDVAEPVEAGEYIDMEMMGTIETEVYDGRKRARLVDFWPLDGEEAELEKETRSKRGKKEDKEEEKPTRSSRRSAKKEKEAITISQDEINDMSQDELEALIEDAELECDLADYRTLGKMRAAVIDAAEKAEILDDDGGEPEEPEKEGRGGARSSRRSSKAEAEKPARRSSRRR